MKQLRKRDGKRQFLTGIAFLIILFSLSACSIANRLKYGEVNEIVEEYLSDTYDMEGQIIDTQFWRYSEGVYGGMYQYKFVFKNKDGSKSTVSYHSYADISKDTLTEYTLKVTDNE